MSGAVRGVVGERELGFAAPFLCVRAAPGCARLLDLAHRVALGLLLEEGLALLQPLRELGRLRRVLLLQLEERLLARDDGADPLGSEVLPLVRGEFLPEEGDVCHHRLLVRTHRHLRERARRGVRAGGRKLRRGIARGSARAPNCAGRVARG